MAAAVFIHRGSAVDYTPSSNVPAGAVVVQGDLVGVTRTALLADQLGSLAVEGVFDFPKEVGDGIEYAAGSLLYWNEAQQVATTIALGNKLIGKAVRTAGETQAKVRVRMSQ